MSIKPCDTTRRAENKPACRRRRFRLYIYWYRWNLTDQTGIEMLAPLIPSPTSAFIPPPLRLAHRSPQNPGAGPTPLPPLRACPSTPHRGARRAINTVRPATCAGTRPNCLSMDRYQAATESTPLVYLSGHGNPNKESRKPTIKPERFQGPPARRPARRYSGLSGRATVELTKPRPTATSPNDR